MPTKYLTDKAVRSIRTEKSQEDFWDEGFKVRGITFGLRVYRSGSREYLCRYRVERKRRFLSLGDAKVLPLSEARARVGEIKESLEKGVDPAREKAKRLEMPTMKELCALYLAQYATRKKDGGKADKQAIARDILPCWAETKVVDIRRRDIIDRLEYITNVREAPISANRTRALLSRLFGFALERDLIQQSPCVGLPEKNAESVKQRTLSDNEIKTIWQNLDRYELIYAAITKILLLTAQRPTEVCGMRWSEIRGDSWTLPSERTKNGKAHLIPLTDEVRRVLDSAKSFSPVGGDFVFPASLGRAVRSRTYLRFIQSLCKDLSIPIFTPHDLRRTARTNFSKLRIAEDVRERLLNHLPSRLERTYDVYDYMLEKRSALLKWERKILALSSNGTTSGLVGLNSPIALSQ